MALDLRFLAQVAVQGPRFEEFMRAYSLISFDMSLQYYLWPKHFPDIPWDHEYYIVFSEYFLDVATRRWRFPYLERLSDDGGRVDEVTQT